VGSWEKVFPLRLVQRALIVRRAADGVQNQAIAQELSVSRPTVQLWRQRFLAFRLEGLEKDAPRPGRIPKIPVGKVQAVVEATLHTTPFNATHWSTRNMAEAQGLSEATIRRIWKQHNLKPHLIQNLQGQPRQTLRRKTVRRCWALPQSSGQVPGAVCRREESDSSSRPNPAGFTDEEGPLWDYDSRLQTQRYNDIICLPSACSMVRLSATVCYAIGIKSLSASSRK